VQQALINGKLYFSKGSHKWQTLFFKSAGDGNVQHLARTIWVWAKKQCNSLGLLKGLAKNSHVLLLQLIKQLFAASGMDVADQPAGNAKLFGTLECSGSCGSNIMQMFKALQLCFEMWIATGERTGSHPWSDQPPDQVWVV